MRIIIAMLAALIVASASDSANADPYRWCAQYAGRNGATNCYFVTLAQCQAAISGNGGFCRVNGFYTGPETPRQRRQRQS